MSLSEVFPPPQLSAEDRAEMRLRAALSTSAWPERTAVWTRAEAADSTSGVVTRLDCGGMGACGAEARSDVV